MSKMTLLEITQDILNSMDSDEVNSVNDTIEAQQVAQIVKTTYYNIIDGREWPHLKKLFRLNHSGNITKMTQMILPEEVTKVEWVKYNKRKLADTKDVYEDVKYLEPMDFISYCNARNSSESYIESVTDNNSSVAFLIRNDVAPSYYTSFDDEYVYFDSYDKDVDTTLQSTKTQAYGVYRPSFSLVDTYVPDLPVHAFSYLLAEAKATAFIDLKQTQNIKAEQNSISQRRRMSQEKWRTNGGIKFPDYGRHK